MKYIVSRTSNFWGKNKPCDEAHEEEFIFVDERCIDDPNKNPFIAMDWYTDAEFFNHRVENGHIKRDRKDKKWVVEIDTLEQLNDFCKKYGNIIIEEAFGIPNQLAIEIYDDWRE